MKDINKIIDSLSPGEQNVMYNALRVKLDKKPEYTIRRMNMVTMSALIRECLALSDLKRKNMLNQLIRYGKI